MRLAEQTFVSEVNVTGGGSHGTGSRCRRNPANPPEKGAQDGLEGRIKERSPGPALCSSTPNSRLSACLPRKQRRKQPLPHCKAGRGQRECRTHGHPFLPLFQNLLRTPRPPGTVNSVKIQHHHRNERYDFRLEIYRAGFNIMTTMVTCKLKPPINSSI